MLLFGCDNDAESIPESALIGSWSLISQSDKAQPPVTGYLFSSDFQFFNLDSQGQTISRFRPKYWNLANDTLILVNTNTEPHLLDTKGTETFFVSELNDSLLKLNSIRAEQQVTYTYQRK